MGGTERCANQMVVRPERLSDAPRSRASPSRLGLVESSRRGSGRAGGEGRCREWRLYAVDRSESDQGVMACEQLAPGAVAELSRLRRRADDVGEENGGEHAVRLALLPAAGVPHLF